MNFNHTHQKPRRLPRRLTVDETQSAVLIRKGRIEGLLDVGIHWLWPADRVWLETRTDQVVLVPGQEMLTSDGAGVRATVATTVAVTDPTLVVTQGGWSPRWYLAVQLALRNAVGAMTLEDLLAVRQQVDTDLALALASAAEQLGLSLRAVAVRDLIVPGQLKHAVAEVVTARLQGQASLERARAETAAVRSLANAAKAVADNPALLQLRLIQQMEASTGNTYVLGAAAQLG